ncbi:MAG: DUF2461 domain-containing protein [Paludibacteraceae bacterium]|nr:DUF2461 domain-containing protein [Paludibacteraceae bacterium]
MNGKNILNFLRQLTINNNREWFAENKGWYNDVKTEFEHMGEALIGRIAEFDQDIRYMQAKDCIFRIYRDTRFSLDKTPYKDHMGIFIAANGGRKSYRGGYYFHLQPDGKSMLAGGVWCPTPELLKELRKSVYDNIDELLDIIQQPTFKAYYPTFWDTEKLKTVPRGFPKDFEHADLLKLKHYMVEHYLTDQEVEEENIIDKAIEGFRIMQPLNAFLNYTVDEVIPYNHRGENK